MYRLLALLLLSLSFSLSATEAPGHGSPHATGTNPDAETRQNMALAGGALIDMLAASGAVGLITSGTMVLEGAGLVEAMEAGAGLTMPLAVLSAVLGAMFTQEYVLQQINAFNAGGHKPAPSH